MQIGRESIAQVDKEGHRDERRNEVDEEKDPGAHSCSARREEDRRTQPHNEATNKDDRDRSLPNDRLVALNRRLRSDSPKGLLAKQRHAIASSECEDNEVPSEDKDRKPPSPGAR